MSDEDIRLWKELMGSHQASFRNLKGDDLVNTREMFRKASRYGYAIPGYNFYNLEQLRGIILGCVDSKSPAILQILRRYLDEKNITSLVFMVKGVLASIAGEGRCVPLALNLDHGNDFEICRKCVDSGFSSVMIDGSYLSYAKNIELTKRVADYAHARGVSVEGELGNIGGAEQRSTAESMFTKPAEAEDFVKKAEVDSLAISIGTVHGPYKSRLENEPVRLRFDILDQIKDKVGDFPLVLHGASGVPSEYVDIVNKYGGRLEGAIGLGDDQLRLAVKKGIRKANFDTDIKLIFTAEARRQFAEKPGEFDPKGHLELAEGELRRYVAKKNKTLGSENGA